jgi:hypothetical protein
MQEPWSTSVYRPKGNDSRYYSEKSLYSGALCAQVVQAPKFVAQQLAGGRGATLSGDQVATSFILCVYRHGWPNALPNEPEPYHTGYRRVRVLLICIMISLCLKLVRGQRARQTRPTGGAVWRGHGVRALRRPSMAAAPGSQCLLGSSARPRLWRSRSLGLGGLDRPTQDRASQVGRGARRVFPRASCKPHLHDGSGQFSGWLLWHSWCSKPVYSLPCLDCLPCGACGRWGRVCGW